MAGVLSLLVVGQQSATTTAAKQDAQQNARMALERMIEEIRESGYLPGGPSCPGAPAVPCPPFNYVFNAITAQSATSLTIQNDWNGSATITAAAVTDPVTGAMVCKDSKGGLSQVCCAGSPTASCFPTAGGVAIVRTG